MDKSPFKDSTVEEDQSVAVVRFAREGLRGEARPIIFPQREEEKATDLLTVPSLSMIKERLADDKFREICVCVSPTQAKKYAIKPVILQTYHQPDAL